MTYDAYNPARLSDSATDARADTPVADAARDAGEIPVPGVWLAIPGFPAECGARVAKDPVVSVSRLPWRPCASGRAGCEAFVGDWGPSHANLFFPNRLEPVFEDAKGVHVSYIRQFGRKLDESQATQSVVQLLHGDGEVTWYGSDACHILAQGSRHGIAVSALYIERPGTPEKIDHQLLGWSSWTDPARLEVEEAVLSPRLNLSQGVARGSGFLTLESTHFGGPIVSTAFRFPQRDFARATPGNDLLSELPLPVAGGYVSLVASVPSTTLAFMPLEGGYRTVVRPAAGLDINYLALDRASGDALVWSETPSGALDGWKLWTSPFATTEAGIAKRPVAMLEFAYQFVANAGMVAAVVSRTTARLVRLSDGMGWDIPAEPDLYFIYPLWVNDDSVWFVVGTPDPIAIHANAHNGVVRIKRAGLGPATVPSGL